jgi:hypothetical protein
MMSFEKLINTLQLAMEIAAELQTGVESIEQIKFIFFIQAV